MAQNPTRKPTPPTEPPAGPDTDRDITRGTEDAGAPPIPEEVILAHRPEALHLRKVDTAGRPRDELHGGRPRAGLPVYLGAAILVALLAVWLFWLFWQG